MDEQNDAGRQKARQRDTDRRISGQKDTRCIDLQIVRYKHKQTYRQIETQTDGKIY
jgi:hypothetical protein